MTYEQRHRRNMYCQMVFRLLAGLVYGGLMVAAVLCRRTDTVSLIAVMTCLASAGGWLGAAIWATRSV